MRIKKIQFAILFTVLSTILFSNVYSQELNTHENDSIAIIIKKNGKELRGMVIYNDYSKIIIESGKNQQLTIPFSEIASIEFISTNMLKNQSEYEQEHLNYTQNCFLPNGYTLDKGDFTINSHYGLSGNAKIGINDNFEFSAGTISFVAYFLSLGFSKEVGEVLQLGINGYGGFTFDFNQSITLPIFCFIPRISLGNKNRNITMGFIGYMGAESYINFNMRYEFMYGAYFAVKNRFKERWSVSSELASITFKGIYTTYMGNFTFNFMRNHNSSWSFGVLGIRSNDPNGIQYLLGYDFLPLPYFGYLRKF